METFVFLVAAAICLCGALGVVLARNPVHSALSLVATLFGVAVLFLNLEAHFLGAVQVIIYAGAIVVLFLFVIMLLGVDRAEDIAIEPIIGQRSAAIVVGGAIFALPVAALATTDFDATGAISNLGAVAASVDPDIEQIGSVLFTRYIYALETTSILLAIAVVGAVLLAKRGPKELLVDLPEPEPEPEAELDDEAQADAEAAPGADESEQEEEVASS